MQPTSYNQLHEPNNKTTAQNHNAENKKWDQARKSWRAVWFVEGKGTTNAIYILRTIAERAIEVQHLCLCFIDYTKASDTIKHKNLINILKTLNIEGRDLRVIKNLYWDQTAALRYNNELGDFVKIKRGARQGCVPSPDCSHSPANASCRRLVIFQALLSKATPSTASNMLMTLPSLRHQKKICKHLLNIINEKSQAVGLGLNKKTVTMVISKTQEMPKCNTRLKDSILQQVEKFKYLGSFITNDGRSINEIRKRIRLRKHSRISVPSLETSTSWSRPVRQCWNAT